MHGWIVCIYLFYVCLSVDVSSYVCYVEWCNLLINILGIYLRCRRGCMVGMIMFQFCCVVCLYVQMWVF